ncbi:MAG: prolyl oligopeptidase family serine peptidase [Phycisphaeraceae bacterium]|nr:prolyl oligopeptidase family serine peptidase [Phycisphaeraceae bacterium]
MSSPPANLKPRPEVPLMPRVLTCLFLILLHGPATAQEDEPARTGIYTTSFEERSPLSDPDRMSAVAGWSRKSMPAYDITDHAFQLVVPKGYDGSKAYGLLVFIHPNNAINTDRFYGKALRDVLAKHELIWVSYNNAGNDVMPNIRLGLALDAVHNVVKSYNIDEEHVYVSGLSGGGRMTCMAGVYYPQVFTGAVPIVGTLYFRDVKLPEDPALRALIKPEPPEGIAAWPRGLLKPSNKTLARMKKHQRWVLLAGETDYNMPQMRAHFEQGFERDGFKHAHYLEVKGMGHNYPDAKWYDRALTLLEKDKEPDGAGEPADGRTQRVAKKRLEVALRTLKRDRARGVRALQRLIDDLPNTEAAAEARQKLESLDKE